MVVIGIVFIACLAIGAMLADIVPYNKAKEKPYTRWLFVVSFAVLGTSVFVFLNLGR